MKHGTTLFLKGVILLMALLVIAGMIRFPQTEGRAVNLDLISIYTDPFIIYIYIASTPFFIGLYQAFKLLNLIDTDNAFSKNAVIMLRNIKFAFMSLIGFIVLALFYIRFFVKGEDSAGPAMLGLCVSVVFGVIATAAGVFQKLFKNAIEIKSENDLTV